jgi:2-polyprenyl-3-methyl-5-hydroxy-6-metoxy-1,4-benzoquinol methylase
MSEARDDRWNVVKQAMGDQSLVFGTQFSDWLQNQPRLLLQRMSYYKFAAKLIGPNKRVLDVGCGEGVGAWLLAVETGFARGIDTNADAIASATSNFGSDPRVEFACEDFLAAASAGWDAVVCVDEIDAQRFCDRARTSLKHDGICVFAAPNDTANAHAELRSLVERFFHHVFLFGANEELIHLHELARCSRFLAVGCRGRS